MNLHYHRLYCLEEIPTWSLGCWILASQEFLKTTMHQLLLMTRCNGFFLSQGYYLKREGKAFLSTALPFLRASFLPWKTRERNPTCWKRNKLQVVIYSIIKHLTKRRSQLSWRCGCWCTSSIYRPADGAHQQRWSILAPSGVVYFEFIFVTLPRNFENFVLDINVHW